MLYYSYSLVFLAGIVSINYYTVIPNSYLLFILVIINSIYLKKIFKSKLVLFFNIFLLALIWGGYSYYNIIHEQWLLTQLYGKPVIINGYINSITYNKNILYKIKSVKMNNQKIKFNYLYLNLKLNSRTKDQFNLDLRLNDYLKIKTLLKTLNYPVNFIDSKFSGYYYNKIFARTIQLDYGSVQKIHHANNKLTNIRQQIWDRFYFLTRELKNNGIILALLFGERSYITDEQNQAFLNTGTGHLIAISGMHISLIFYLLMKISLRIWPSSLYKINSIPREKYAYVLSWFITLFYSYLSGFSVSNQRAFIAITVFCLCKLFYFNISNFNIFGICLILVLIYDPFVVYSAGFWLSFIATIWLLYFYCNRYDNHISNYYENIKNNIVSSSYMFIALMPVTIFYFNKFSILSAFANMIAIPVVNILILPLSFIALFLLLVNFTDVGFILSLINKILIGVDYLLEKLIYYLKFIDNLSPDIFKYYNYFDNFNLLILSLIIIVLLAPRGWPKIPIITLLSTIYYFNLYYGYNSYFKKNSGLTIDILDIGQGLSVLVNTKHHQLLYDTGPKLFGNYIAEKVVVNSILNYSKKLDTIVISHWDADHSVNLENIIKNLKPDNITELMSSDNRSNQKILSNFTKFNNQIKSGNCNTDYAWQWDGVVFQFIKNHDNPTNIYMGNNSSCVLKITDNNTSILLTGDIEEKTETKLQAQHTNLLNSTILLVPHHGSKTSSSYNFIKQVNPKYAVISVGNDNIYRLPNYAIISRYEELGIKLYRTDLQGGIRIKVANDAVEFNCAKYNSI